MDGGRFLGEPASCMSFPSLFLSATNLRSPAGGERERAVGVR